MRQEKLQLLSNLDLVHDDYEKARLQVKGSPLRKQSLKSTQGKGTLFHVRLDGEVLTKFDSICNPEKGPVVTRSALVRYILKCVFSDRFEELQDMVKRAA